ncbi:MAG: MBL fold metallo-hydrolase [Dehalococcoidia bacterium]|nr:MBL fold metallo-hydrolase [Dehalococcoidia bacterium]
MFLKTLPVGSYQANCYLYAASDADCGFIIDPGGNAEAILKHVRETNFKATAIILTHGHPDHCYASLPIKKALNIPFWAHEQASSTLKDSITHTWLGFEYQELIPDKWLNEGDTLNSGQTELKVIHTPGHTPGCISLLGEGIVFTGDTLFCQSVGRTDFPGGDPYVIVESIKQQLLTLADDTIVLPGHGPASTIGEERRNNPFLR